jgi:hypothetical protein
MVTDLAMMSCYVLGTPLRVYFNTSVGMARQKKNKSSFIFEHMEKL